MRQIYLEPELSEPELDDEEDSLFGLGRPPYEGFEKIEIFEKSIFKTRTFFNFCRSSGFSSCPTGLFLFFNFVKNSATLLLLNFA